MPIPPPSSTPVLGAAPTAGPLPTPPQPPPESIAPLPTLAPSVGEVYPKRDMRPPVPGSPAAAATPLEPAPVVSAVSAGVAGSQAVINRGAHATWQYRGEPFRAQSNRVINHLRVYLPVILAR